MSGSSPITVASPSSKAYQKSGPFPPSALADLTGTMILSDSRQFPAPKTAPLRPRPPIPTGLPRYPEHLSDVPSPLPRRTKMGGQMVSSAQLPQPSPFCRRVGVRVFTLEACSAFTHVMARTDRSTAQGGLYHGASVQPVTRSNCPLATGSNQQVSRWVLPPLAFRAIVAHYRTTVLWT